MPKASFHSLPFFLQNISGFLWLVFSLLFSTQLFWMSQKSDYSALYIRGLVCVVLALLVVGLMKLAMEYWIRLYPSKAHFFTPALNIKMVLVGLGLMFIPFGWEAVIIFLYLFVCFLAVAPIFLDKYSPIPIPYVLIGTCIGVMLSGFVYVLSIILGFPSMLPTMTVAFAIALINTVLYRHQLIASLRHNLTSLHQNLTWENIVCITIFVFYGGFILVASLKMGFGDYPLIFFNMDTPLRLAQAHKLVATTIYPPESLMIKGMFHAYHYGAPATVAAVARVANLPVHKIMFWVVVPLFLVSGFSTFVLIVHKVVKHKIRKILGLIIILPIIFLGNYAYQFFLGGEFKTRLVNGLVGDSLPGTYDPELFTRGVADVSVIAGFFLLGAAALLCVERKAGRVLALVPILAVLTIFIKMNMAAAVYSMLGISLLIIRTRVREPLFFGALVVLTTVPIVLLILLGYAHTTSETSMLTVRPFSDVLDYFNGRKNWTLFYLREIIIAAVIATPVVSFWIFKRQANDVQQSSRLILATLVMMIVSWGVVAVFDIPKVGVQFSTPLWLGIPLVSIALLGIDARHIDLARIPLLAPIIFVAVIGQWNKLHHMSVAIVLPEYVEEYADNRLLGEALSYVPIRFGLSDPMVYSHYVDRHPDLLSAFETRLNESENEIKAEWGKLHYVNYGQREKRKLITEPILVTNDFRYISWPDSQPQIPALFGHQAYGVHLRHFPGPRGFNREGERRIGHQLRRLSRSFSRKNPEFSAETLRQAEKSGWTHFILRKDVDDGLPPINANDIPLKKLYENERYAVFDLRAHNL